MSLLLDALKKAAEQKAGKQKGERLSTSSSDETIIDPPAEDLTEISDGEDRTLLSLEEDGTQLDSTDVESRYQQTEFEADRTEFNTTALDTDYQKTDFESDKTAIDSTEREHQTQTQIDHDKTEVDGTETKTQLDQTSYESEQTELDNSQLTSGDHQTQTQIDHDKTEVDGTETKTQFDQTSYDSEKTEIDSETVKADRTEIDSTEVDTRYQQSEKNSDTADLTQPEETYVSTVLDQRDEDEILSTRFDEDEAIVFGEDDVTSFMGDPVEEVRREKFQSFDSGKKYANDTQTDLVDIDADEDITTSGDISLTLFKQEDDTTASELDRNPDRLNADTELQLLHNDETSTDGLNLANVPDDGAQTQTQRPALDSTSVTGINHTLASRGVSSDSTSTQTYAPDNYDRTLMKLPNDDASMLFAGMKSEADVVMTPDYAKKVFLSKSSANRLQYYKAYAAIAFVILLTIGIIGSFELQSESDNIDVRLRPLKIDPMPGVIRSASTSIQPEILFNTAAAEEVDLKTLAMIENAEAQTGDQPITATAEPEPEAVRVETEAGNTSSDSVARENTAQQSESSAAVKKEPVVTAQANAVDSQQGSSSLQISSSRQADQKDVLLREAYAAYSTGNDAVALSKYNQVIGLDPENRNALLARAAINIQNNNSQAAIKDYQAILLVNPKDSLAMTSMIAVASFSPRETESQLKLMIRDEPDSPHLNFALANVYGGQGRWQEAQGHYFKALENNPTDPNYAYNLAVSLEHIAKPKIAVPYYQRALANINNGLATFNKDVVSQRLEMLGKL